MNIELLGVLVLVAIPMLAWAIIEIVLRAI